MSCHTATIYLMAFCPRHGMLQHAVIKRYDYDYTRAHTQTSKEKWTKVLSPPFFFIALFYFSALSFNNFM